MIPVPDYAGRVVVVLGLDERGLATARALAAGGARLLVWDDRIDERGRAEDEGFEVADVSERDWGDIAALVVDPSAKPGRIHELAALTRTPILCDIELFARALAARPPSARGRVVAVTGQRGKSTTAALIGQILKGAGRDAQVGGGAGAPTLALAQPHPGAVYVLELQARDIELSPSLAPKVAVLLNAESPDGREPPGAAAQAQIFLRQKETDHAVVGVDDAFGRAVAVEIGAREGGPALVPVSVSRALGRGVHAVGGLLFDAIDGRAHEALDLRRVPSLIGRGAWQNAAAAYAACRILGMEPGKIAEQIGRFQGVAHRLELVGVQGGARFYDDSMASDPGAVRQGLANFENIYWIAGGGVTGAAFASLVPLMPRVSKAYFIGEAAETIAAQLKGRVVAEICRSLATAVERAAADASRSKRADPVVLFSPGCAPGEKFADAAARGDAFRAVIRGLPGWSAPGEAA